MASCCNHLLVQMAEQHSNISNLVNDVERAACDLHAIEIGKELVQKTLGMMGDTLCKRQEHTIFLNILVRDC